MKIAVIDDEKLCRDHLISLIKAYPKVEFEIEEFCSGEKFLESDIEKYSIAFLDIEMPEMNGIETATKILEKKASILIFYVTNHNSYISKALRCNTFQFITKPINQEELFIDLNRALIEIKRNIKFIKVIWNGQKERLFIQDILYIESNNKIIKIVMMNDSVYNYSKKLSELLEELKFFNFELCHKSYIVNLQHVEAINTDNVELSNHKFVPMSKRFKKRFKCALNLFINEVTL